eukprot:tig00000480_g1317.t1
MPVSPVDALLSTLTCGDIVDQAKQLLMFLDEIRRLEESHTMSLKDPNFLMRAVERYIRFLDIRATDASVLPPIDVAFVWLCHLLRPGDYIRACMNAYKAVLQPDGDIFRSAQDGDRRRLATNMWNAIFPDDPFPLTLSPGFRPKESGVARREDLARSCGQFLALIDSVKASGLPVHSPVFLQRAARRWVKFMILCQRHPAVILIPTLDVELMWIAHLANPRSYKEDTERIIGHLLLHDEYMPLQDLAGTSELWEREFGEEYARNPWGILSGRTASQAQVAAGAARNSPVQQLHGAAGGPAFLAQGGRHLSTVLVPGFRFDEGGAGPATPERGPGGLGFRGSLGGVGAALPEEIDMDRGEDGLALRASVAAATGRASAARSLAADLSAAKGRTQSVSFAVDPSTPEGLAPRSFGTLGGAAALTPDARTRSLAFDPHMGGQLGMPGSPYGMHGMHAGADFSSPAGLAMAGPSFEADMAGKGMGMQARGPGAPSGKLKHSFVSSANLGTSIYDGCCQCHLCECCVQEGCPKCECCNNCECRACPECCRGMASACGHCCAGCCNACGQACSGFGQACGGACLECRNTCRQSCAPCCSVLEECGKSCSVCVGGIATACAPFAKWIAYTIWFSACLAVFAVGIAREADSSYDETPGWEFGRMRDTWTCQLMAGVGGLAFWAGVAHLLCRKMRPLGHFWWRLALCALGCLGVAGGFAFTEEGRGEAKNCVGVIVATMGASSWALVAVPWLHRYFLLNLLAPDGLMLFVWGIVQQRRIGNNAITLYLVIFGAVVAFVPVLLTFLVWSGPSHQRAIRWYLGRNIDAIPTEKLSSEGPRGRGAGAGAAYGAAPMDLSSLPPEALKLLAAAAATPQRDPADVTYQV